MLGNTVPKECCNPLPVAPLCLGESVPTLSYSVLALPMLVVMCLIVYSSCFFCLCNAFLCVVVASPPGPLRKVFPMLVVMCFVVFRFLFSFLLS